MEDEQWLDQLETEIASTKWLQWIEILKTLDMTEVRVVDCDIARDPLGQFPNAALTTQYDAVISIPWSSLFGPEDDDAC